jgi:hypothetical protein
MKHARFAIALLLMLVGASAAVAGEDKAPLLTSIPTVLIRSPYPIKLAQYYVALGFNLRQTSATGTHGFVLEGDVGSLEILRMDKNTQPSGPKTSRTQQGVVAIFETTDQAALVARAKAAGATLIEKFDAQERSDVSIYYIADPENNILGFAPRHHNTSLKTP